MRTPEGIKVIPAPYEDVLALLKSDALAAVEDVVAARCAIRTIDDHGAAQMSYMQAAISLSGMTTGQLENYLSTNQLAIITFCIRIINHTEATGDEQEYPEGEEQDPDEEIESLGYGNGFGLTCAIYHNFLANRTPAELRAFLKNRRIPKHTKFANELASMFAAVATKGSE